MLQDSNLTYTDVLCHICGAQQLNLLTDYPTLPRVASDCTPWRAGGRLGTCGACDCVQNPVDSAWQNETTAIYDRYLIYRQSAGSEQGVFSGGKPLVPRSAKVFQHAMPYLNLEKSGRLLDIGCANGELLRCFGKLAPTWKLTGFEIDDKRRKEVESIPGVEQFASGALDKLTHSFDIITLIHVLEHLPSPQQWLIDLKSHLNPDGMVLIQVPDPKQNPYNLLVADHCSHFIMPDLLRIAENAGYQIIAYSDKWVSREFSLLIKPLQSNTSHITPNAFESNTDSSLTKTATYPNHAIRWLHDIVQLAKTMPTNKPRGIWGTAIAATWLYSLMDENVDFFVDEDANRIGHQHLGKPIYSPDNIPADSNVFIALTPELANNIASRWTHLDVNLHTPPALVY